jgi:chorismate mutase
MIEKIREEIDSLDIQIQKLLEKRLKLALQTLKYKKKISDKKREKEILEKISSIYIKDIYKAILKNSKKYQKDLIEK